MVYDRQVGVGVDRSAYETVALFLTKRPIHLPFSLPFLCLQMQKVHLITALQTDDEKHVEENMEKFVAYFLLAERKLRTQSTGLSVTTEIQHRQRHVWKNNED